MEQYEAVLARLDELGVEYELRHHPAVFTIEEMQLAGVDRECEVCKNLFLRDEKGRRHFLVVLPGNKHADLKEIQQKLGCSRLSFASEERLMKHLALTKGSVTPLAVINDAACAVEVALDGELRSFEKLGVHPNDNTMTVILTFDDMVRYLRVCGHEPVML